MIHLYAFTEGLGSLPPRTGVEGEALEARTLEDVVAVVGVVDGNDRPDSSTAAALAHGLVVEALLERGDSVLPVRYGERFADDAALRAAAIPRLPMLRRRLGDLRGTVEVAVRVLEAGEPERGRAADGTAYMRRKLEALERRRAAASALHEPLRALARDVRVSQLPGAGVLHEAAYLVTRDDVSACVGLVERYAAAHHELTVVCTGPWAPYSFAEAAR